MLRVSRPVDELLAGDEVDVWESQDGVKEVEESLAPVGAVEEPGGVEEEWEGSLGLCVVLEEVLREDLLNGSGVLVVETPVSHGAAATADILDRSHGDLPHSRVAELGTGLDGAGVRHLVLQGVGPTGRRGRDAGEEITPLLKQN